MKIRNLEELIEDDEGRVDHVYLDSEGYETLGVGHLIDKRKGGGIPPSLAILFEGVNIHQHVPDHLITVLRDYDIAEARREAQTIIGYALADPVRQDVMVSMVFQLGMEPFDGDGFKDFKKFLVAIKLRDYVSAATEMLDSLWARQTPKRAKRLAHMMAQGRYPE